LCHSARISLTNLIVGFKSAFNGKKTIRKGDAYSMTILLCHSAEIPLIHLIVGYYRIAYFFNFGFTDLIKASLLSLDKDFNSFSLLIAS
jgi:hypothetical protein